MLIELTVFLAFFAVAAYVIGRLVPSVFVQICVSELYARRDRLYLIALEDKAFAKSVGFRFIDSSLSLYLAVITQDKSAIARRNHAEEFTKMWDKSNLDKKLAPKVETDGSSDEDQLIAIYTSTELAIKSVRILLQAQALMSLLVMFGPTKDARSLVHWLIALPSAIVLFAGISILALVRRAVSKSAGAIKDVLATTYYNTFPSFEGLSRDTKTTAIADLKKWIFGLPASLMQAVKPSVETLSASEEYDDLRLVYGRVVQDSTPSIGKNRQVADLHPRSVPA